MLSIFETKQDNTIKAKCYFSSIMFMAGLVAALFVLAGCSAQTVEPFKVTNTVETACLNGAFEMDIPEGMSSDGVQSFSDDTETEAFYPDNGGTSSRIFIISQEISPYFGADTYVSTRFDEPPKDATYRYKNIKVKALSRGHYMSSADLYEDGAEESKEKEVCFSMDGDIAVTISFENLQKSYTNTVESTIRVL